MCKAQTNKQQSKRRRKQHIPMAFLAPRHSFTIFAARLWWTRLVDRTIDVVSLASFSLSPFASVSTWLTVHKQQQRQQQQQQQQQQPPVALRLSQWPGSQVGSGGFVWEGARRLIRHFERHGDGCGITKNRTFDDNVPRKSATIVGTLSVLHHNAAIPSRDMRKLHCLELGSGTGAAGLAVAAMYGVPTMTLTDQATFCYKGLLDADTPSLLDLMRHNVATNAHILTVVPQVAEMLWGNTKHMTQLPPLKQRPRGGYNSYDVIFGTDILLFDHRAELIQSLRCLSSASTVVLIQHTDRSDYGATYPSELLSFFKLVDTDGLWSPTVVKDQGRHITIRMVRRQPGDTHFGNIMDRSSTYRY